MHTFLLLISLALLAVSLTPWMPWQAELIDLSSHFVLQYAVAAVFFLAVTLIIGGQPRLAVFLALIAALNIIQLYPYLPFGGKNGAGSFKILQANTLRYNEDAAPFKALIAAENPDIIVTAETNSVFAAMFENMKTAYPHQKIIVSDHSSFGMAVLSKLPFEKMTQESFYNTHIPSFHFQVKHDSRIIDFLSMHPANPLKDLAGRDREFENVVRKFSGRVPENFVIVGDLNATVYCMTLKKMMKTLKLTDARRGRSIMGSYPLELPTSLLRLPIDHVLTNAGIAVTGQKTGPDIGSDHLPMITTFSLASSLAATAHRPESR